MKKSRTFRVISGVIVASTLLVLPATATAAVRELTRPAPAAGDAQAARLAEAGAGYHSGSARRTAPATADTAAVTEGNTATVADKATAAGKAAATDKATAAAARLTAETGPAKSIPGPAVLPFRLAVPGATASGTYAPVKGRPGNPQVTVSLKVTGRGPCGVLQLTRNGPADGIEWHTVGALCGSGTATLRTQINRLWGSRALPSIRLCNGDSVALAEGVDCDDYAPPRGA
jgi:hypothetical protein